MKLSKKRVNKTRRSNVTSRIVFRMGKRIYLRAVLTEDIPLITVWINDPEVHQFLKIAYPMSPEDEKKWQEGLAGKKPGDVVFAIVLADTDEIIGVMGLHHIDHRNGLATTGAFIGRKDLWSKGYGTEAKMLVLEYAFNTLNLRKVCSAVYDFNGRSKRCLEKCGYTPEGCRKKHLYRNGRFVDEYLMAVFKEDFLPRFEKFKKEFLESK